MLQVAYLIGKSYCYRLLIHDSIHASTYVSPDGIYKKGAR